MPKHNLSSMIVVIGLLIHIISIAGYANGTDMTAPRVIRTVPEDRSLNISPFTPIYISLVDPQANASGVNPDTISMRVNGEQVYIEVYQYNQTTYVMFSHYEPFPFQRINVTIEACDFAHNCMEPYNFWFEVSNDGGDHVPPWAFSPEPAPYSEEVDPDSPVLIMLSDRYEHMYPSGSSGIDIDSIVMKVDDVIVPLHVNEEASIVSVEYTHDEPLPADQQITIIVNACDNAGNCMAPFVWTFETSNPDTTPPYLVSTLPTDGELNVEVSTSVIAIISDSGVGVDTTQIALTVDGVAIANPVIMEDNLGYRITYDPETDFSAYDSVTIRLTACDLADNCNTFEWTFRTGSNTNAPELVYPPDKMWLNYINENGRIRFSWINSEHLNHFRLRVYIPGVSVPSEVDYGPGDYVIAFGLSTVSYPVNATSWDVLAQLGTLEWEVAQISQYAGEEITAYSERFELVLAPSDALTLRSPQDFSTIPEDQPPTFKWYQHPEAESYLIGFARLGEDGVLIDEVFADILPIFITEIPLTRSTWVLLPNGSWLWTVVPIRSDGSYGSFMIGHFTKIPAQ